MSDTLPETADHRKSVAKSHPTLSTSTLESSLCFPKDIFYAVKKLKFFFNL